jgi:molecular chaperone DnaJ
MIHNPCKSCGGTGRVKRQKRITLKIPKGVETGSRLRISGKGEGGLRGGPSGDLYVVMHVKSHPIFQRREDDLFCEVPIPFDMLAMGGVIQVPTIDGLAKLKLDAGTETGKVYRLRAKGMPSVDGRGRGDLHVQVVPEVPVKLNSKQKKALAEFRDASTPSNYPKAKHFRDLGEQLLERKRAMKKG